MMTRPPSPARAVLAAAALSVALGLAPHAAAGEWPMWRGPTGDGKAAPGADPPVEFGAERNVIWKTALPGRGHASPTIVGDRIFLATADPDAATSSVLAVDRRDGKILWQRVVLEGGMPRKIHSKNTHASSTVASDGERVFATFFNDDSLKVVALDFDGEILWRTTAGRYAPRKYEFGYGASPTVFASMVIVAAESEDGCFLAALDAATGEQVWKTPRPGLPSFSSPVVAHLAGRDQLVISGNERMAAYDPRTGAALWQVKGSSPATCGTAVWDGDIVIASGGYPNKETVAVHADGSARVAWRNSEKCYEQSLLAHDGYVYALTDNATAFCWDAASGAEQWSVRLGGGPVSASPVLAGGRIYAANERGTFFVFAASPEGFDLLAQNKLGDEVFASPAVCGDRLYARVGFRDGGERQEVLFCIGAPRAP